MTEQWLPIPGWPNYEVSDAGHLRRVALGGNGRRTCTVAGSIYRSTGYRMVVLCGGGRRWKVAFHTLVALAFLGPRPTAAHQVAHWDGDRVNNRVANLRWATAQENSADRIRHGMAPSGEQHPMAKLSAEAAADIRAACARGHRQRDVAARFGIHQATVHRIVAGKAWRHLGTAA